MKGWSGADSIPAMRTTDEYKSPYPDDRITREELVRALRGNIHTKRLAYEKLVANGATEQAISEALAALETAIQRARDENVPENTGGEE